MEISAIEPRRRGVSALFLDGEFAVNLDTRFLAESPVRLGQEITDEELQDLIRGSNARRAREKALYLLEHRSHSKKELEDKVARTAGKEAAQEAANHMQEIGLVNDEQFARDYARQLVERKGFARRRAEYELLQKGIDRDLIEQVLEELLPEPREKLTELIEKKYARSLGDEKGLRRTMAALQRLGYRGEDIRAALRRFSELEE